MKMPNLPMLKRFASQTKWSILVLPWLVAGCVTPVDYGKIPHADYVAPDRCNPSAAAVVDGNDKPFFFVTSRLPNCLSEDISLLHHRADQVRYGRFAGPRDVKRGSKKPTNTIPLALAHPQNWWKSLDDQMVAADGRVLLYVHGYRETFYTSSRDTAQIARLTGFAGPIIQYSWPSQGALLKYPVDESNMYWDERNFRKFLMQLAQLPSTKEIVLLSHSLGARLVLPSLEYVDRNVSNGDSSVISNIILASPDVDTQDFERDIAEEILSDRRVRNDRRITVYASIKDRALSLSNDFHGYPRLGYPRCFDPFEAADLRANNRPERCYAAHPEYTEEIDKTALTIVDTSATSRGRTGHSNYLLSAPVCRDFVAVVNGDRMPEGRKATHLDHVFILPPVPKGEKPDHLALCRRTE
ncbi:MAG: alpha/beta hydrolase [Parasphingorhabdus sp.]|uniref:alpha/beta hydrolase n=1 Tax=Parasphingorhabdus sp. TaxID=2709688 RepID=UPI003263C1C2